MGIHVKTIRASYRKCVHEFLELVTWLAVNFPDANCYCRKWIVSWDGIDMVFYYLPQVGGWGQSTSRSWFYASCHQPHTQLLFHKMAEVNFQQPWSVLNSMSTWNSLVVECWACSRENRVQIPVLADSRYEYRLLIFIITTDEDKPHHVVEHWLWPSHGASYHNWRKISI